MFASKITSAARSMNLVNRPARDIDMLRHRLERFDDGKGCDPVTGVIIDLAMGDIAMQMIQHTKAFDAQLPVVAFGGHLNNQELAAARTAGADFVMTNGQLAANLTVILERLKGMYQG
ncbi:MAG: hypothetical protein HC898_00920 [Phycisphaerales bacterium]|nr:hypothetical protein [Phycisphaerales bacterium]